MKSNYIIFYKKFILILWSYKVPFDHFLSYNFVSRRQTSKLYFVLLYFTFYCIISTQKASSQLRLNYMTNISKSKKLMLLMIETLQFPGFEYHLSFFIYWRYLQLFSNLINLCNLITQKLHNEFLISKIYYIFYIIVLNDMFLFYLLIYINTYQIKTYIFTAYMKQNYKLLFDLRKFKFIF